MADEYPTSEASARIWHALIDDAIGEIYAHESPQQLIKWVRDVAITEYYQVFPASVTEEMASPLANSLGRAIWNATPLPGNGFKPKTLAKPERNRPCPCGSGRKYKHCCADMPEMGAVDMAEIWPMVIGRLSSEQLRDAIRGRHIPPATLAEMAMENLEDGNARAAVKLLEPVFSSSVKRLDERAASAFDVLCDAYNQLDWERKKLALIEQLIKEGSRELQSEAWQRKATLLLDKQQREAAWVAHRNAQRLTPRNPSIGLLEVNLLMGENRVDEARGTAEMWCKRLRRDGFEEDEPILEFFTAAAADPGALFSDISMSLADDGAAQLRDLVADIEMRPAPTYRIGHPELTEGTEEEDLAGRLASMGLDKSAIAKAMANLADQLPESSEESSHQPQLDLFTEDPIDADDTVANEDEPPMLQLLCPPGLQDIEAAWEAVYPIGKPFSVAPVPQTEIDPWEPALFGKWAGFLRENPAAFDSMTILDDITCAVDLLHTGPWIDETLSRPLLDRAYNIVEQALYNASDDERQLPWLIGENRPALRMLNKRALLLDAHEKYEQAGSAFQMMLRLNHHDNHGVRAPYVNILLKCGRYKDALVVIAGYPDDITVDIGLGKIFALHCLGRETDARVAIQQLPDIRATAVKFLTRARVKAPNIDDIGVRIGGDDEAWLYREEMRETWAAVPGLLDWLKKHAQEVGMNADPQT